jgi:hypothetical protein
MHAMLAGSIVAQLFAVMSRKPFLVMAALLSIAPADALYAQDEGEKPVPTVRTADGGREAVTRGDRPRAVERSAPQPAAPPSTATSAIRPAGAPAAATAAPAADDQRRRGGTRDRDDGARDRGDNPAVGRAVPREASPPPARTPRTNAGGGFDGRNRGVFVAPRVYNNYYYYPRRYYPYGYGAFGLGYFYYDPYTWYPPTTYPGYYGSYSGGYYDPFFFDVGELRLIVSPRSADVYVDGYFAGRVDDYDGIFQALKLEAGAHHIQIVAQGHSPLDFDVRIEPNRKITYRGTLRP